MIQSIYYEILEYVIAPIGLMIFTFFVKSKNTVAIRTIKFSENAIESLFIASYSHLLYYFSLCAHEGNIKFESVKNDQFAALTNSIAGLLTIFVFKYFYEKLDGDRLRKLTRTINYTAFGLMCFLAVIIVDSNMNFHNSHLSLSSKDANKWLVDFIYFIIRLNNLIFIPFIGFILFIVIIKPIVRVNPSLKSYILTNKNVSDEKSNENYQAIASEIYSPMAIRISSYVKLAIEFLKNQDHIKSMEAITNAKNLAITSNYPESELIAIRSIKVELHCILNQKDKALKEVSEVEQNKSRDSDSNKEFYGLWIKKLEDIIRRY